jgi:hypothetical protein
VADPTRDPRGDPCICGDATEWHQECYRKPQPIGAAPGVLRPDPRDAEIRRLVEENKRLLQAAGVAVLNEEPKP